MLAVRTPRSVTEWNGPHSPPQGGVHTLPKPGAIRDTGMLTEIGNAHGVIVFSRGDGECPANDSAGTVPGARGGGPHPGDAIQRNRRTGAGFAPPPALDRMGDTVMLMVRSHMKKLFKPNIGRTGRILRGAAGLALLGVAAWVYQVSLPACLLLAAAGLFCVFEALRGWCAVRACGVRTRW